jgi:hypothetical protein
MEMCLNSSCRLASLTWHAFPVLARCVESALYTVQNVNCIYIGGYLAWKSGCNYGGCLYLTNTQPDSSNLQFMHSKSLLVPSWTRWGKILRGYLYFLVTVLKNNTYMSKWNITALSASYTEILFTNCNYLKNNKMQSKQLKTAVFIITGK